MKMWMFNCREISRLVSDSMDRRLSWQRRMGIRFHLLMCRHCTRYQQQLRYIRKLLRTFASASEDSSYQVLDEQAKERLRRLVEKDDSSAGKP